MIDNSKKQEKGKTICGIDEAGRGPVIGSMVIAGVAISEENLHKLEKLDVRDSKLMTHKQRERAFQEIVQVADSYHIVYIHPEEIDMRNSVGTNLNKLEAIKAAEIIMELRPDKVIVDSPEPARAQKFGDMILNYLPEDLKPEIRAEHKADVNYKIVSAASILAKVTRDAEIESLKKEFNCDFGSGYPSDPKCKEFLEKNENKEIEKHMRKCWAPYKEKKKREEQSKLDKF